LSDQLSEFKYTKDDEAAWLELREKRKKERFYTDGDEDMDALDTEQMYSAISILEKETLDEVMGANSYYKILDEPSKSPEAVEF